MEQIKINKEFIVENSYNELTSLKNISDRAANWDICSKGYVLWTNPNDSQDFSSQTLNVDYQGCSWFKIIYKINKGDAACIISEIPFPGILIRCSVAQYGQVAGRDLVAGRSVNFQGNNQVYFDNCVGYGIRNDSYVNVTQNDMLIPIRIVGYKNSWNNR